MPSRFAGVLSQVCSLSFFKTGPSPNSPFSNALSPYQPLPFQISSHQIRSRSTIRDFGNREPFWQKLPPLKNYSSDDFNTFAFQAHNVIYDRKKLGSFLYDVLPDIIPPPTQQHHTAAPQTRDELIQDVFRVFAVMPMQIRLPLYVTALMDFADPLNDPVFRQFIPMRSTLVPDHPNLKRDSLDERVDTRKGFLEVKILTMILKLLAVDGLVHRYPGKALFLCTNMCPLFCSYCTRSYMVGSGGIEKEPQKPDRARWETIFRHIENDQTLQDIVVSGGDTYTLAPSKLRLIGERLLQIQHVRRIRFASKGLVAAPGRLMDATDEWTRTLIDLSNAARKAMKAVYLHTHINHSREITWVTAEAANFLYREGVTVRNQAVMLRGVNDTTEAQSDLMHDLVQLNIQPYYVYQGDMIPGIEHLRTPLSTTIRIEKELRGTMSGFMIPSFVVDLPCGGGKRLVSTYEEYDKNTGVSTWRAPGLPGEKGKRQYTYYDPQLLNK